MNWCSSFTRSKCLRGLGGLWAGLAEWFSECDGVTEPVCVWRQWLFFAGGAFEWHHRWVDIDSLRHRLQKNLSTPCLSWLLIMSMASKPVEFFPHHNHHYHRHLNFWSVHAGTGHCAFVLSCQVVLNFYVIIGDVGKHLKCDLSVLGSRFVIYLWFEMFIETILFTFRGVSVSFWKFTSRRPGSVSVPMNRINLFRVIWLNTLWQCHD